MCVEGFFCGGRTEKDSVQGLGYIYSLSAPAALALSL